MRSPDGGRCASLEKGRGRQASRGSLGIPRATRRLAVRDVRHRPRTILVASGFSRSDNVTSVSSGSYEPDATYDFLSAPALRRFPALPAASPRSHVRRLRRAARTARRRVWRCARCEVMCGRDLRRSGTRRRRRRLRPAQGLRDVIVRPCRRRSQRMCRNDDAPGVCRQRGASAVMRHSRSAALRADHLDPGWLDSDGDWPRPVCRLARRGGTSSTNRSGEAWPVVRVRTTAAARGHHGREVVSRRDNRAGRSSDGGRRHVRADARRRILDHVRTSTDNGITGRPFSTPPYPRLSAARGAPRASCACRGGSRQHARGSVVIRPRDGVSTAPPPRRSHR